VGGVGAAVAVALTTLVDNRVASVVAAVVGVEDTVDVTATALVGLPVTVAPGSGVGEMGAFDSGDGVAGAASASVDVGSLVVVGRGEGMAVVGVDGVSSGIFVAEAAVSATVGTGVAGESAAAGTTQASTNASVHAHIHLARWPMVIYRTSMASPHGCPGSKKRGDVHHSGDPPSPVAPLHLWGDSTPLSYHGLRRCGITIELQKCYQMAMRRQAFCAISRCDRPNWSVRGNRSRW